MYCPECGNDAGSAKFCPECGADLSNVKSALQGKTTGQQGGKTTARQGGKAGAGGAGRQAAAPAGKGISPAIIWGGFGALAVVVLVAVVMISGGLGGGSTGTGGTGSPAPVTQVKADVSGSYRELVQKANVLYDQGDKAFQSQNFEQGSAYFQAAGMTYAAAWGKQKTDPAVGTDFATSLFYSGGIEAALKQIEAVIAKFPKYQPAQYNLGNYLTHKARIAEQSGDKKAAADDYAAAKTAYSAAVAMDPASDVGKQAAARLKELPK
ncbi:MAG: zinc ribbon domain-containing protein [Thermoleophilia bacterium]